MKRPIKVLIIEDDSNIVELIELYMDKIGFSSIFAFFFAFLLRFSLPCLFVIFIIAYSCNIAH